MHLNCNFHCLQYHEGLFLESFSVELVVLAIWKKALQICSSWLASSAGSELTESSSANESNTCHSDTIDDIDLGRPSSANKWVEQEFIDAHDFAEKLSNHIRNRDG